MTHLSIELPEDLAARLSAAAERRHATTQDLVVAAVRDALAAEEELATMIACGEADFAAGRVVPHEEVMRELEAWAAGLGTDRATLR